MRCHGFCHEFVEFISFMGLSLLKFSLFSEQSANQGRWSGHCSLKGPQWSTRGQMFYLNPLRPNALEPHKRPRATLTPTLVTQNGDPYMVFGTPGGDAQEQWTSQFFLNYVDFGMDIQEALDAPTVHSTHFPSSFYPRPAYPGRG